MSSWRKPGPITPRRRGEECRSVLILPTIDRSRGMGPGFRQDDSKGSGQGVSHLTAQPQIPKYLCCRSGSANSSSEVPLHTVLPRSMMVGRLQQAAGGVALLLAHQPAFTPALGGDRQAPYPAPIYGAQPFAPFIQDKHVGLG